MSDYVLAVDQGTTSTRAIIFDRSGCVVATGQLEHQQILPQPGWVEHDPMEIWANAREATALALARANLISTQIAAVGITNQRETTLVWDRRTGEPVYNAIVWQDTRTAGIVADLAREGDIDRYADQVGLPLATYFAGPKLKWILDNVPGVRVRAERGELAFGTIDTWLIWNATGGVEGGIHVTDVTNASRTMLMNLDTLTWNEQIAADLTIPMSMLPQIRSSVEIYGYGRGQGLLPGVPIAADLGDQQAALFGQACFDVGAAKTTYGTGNFMLVNTGTKPVRSDAGLLTTVGYRIRNQDPVYALEGSIAVTGDLVKWLRDNLGLIATSDDVETLAKQVPDNGGAYFVPAFSGLFAPYWRPDARGVLIGLTSYVNSGHLARAVLEATAFQTRDVLEVMDPNGQLTELKVDGGMVVNDTLMQFQADLLGVPVIRPQVSETTALGAAYAAGIAVGLWADEAEVAQNWTEGKRWTPAMDPAERERTYRLWKKAVTRALDWVDEDVLGPPSPGESAVIDA